MMLPGFVQRIPVCRRPDVAAWAGALAGSARHDSWLLLWRIVTLPLWLASDIPMPGSPSWQRGSWGALEHIEAGPGRHVRDQLAALLRRYRWSWLVTALLRGVALGLWIALAWTLVSLATDVAMPNRWWIAGLILAGLLLGGAFGLVNRPTPLRLALSLDQTFRLDERLTTALDPAPMSSYPAARELQYADTANGLAEIRPELGIGSFIPFREVFVALIAGLLLLAAFFANVPGGDLPPAASGAVPPFASAADRLAAQQTPPPATNQQVLPQETPQPDAETLEEAETSNQTRLDLEALGNALSDYALTRPASDAIAAGDYDQAADDLRSAAENADSLSPDAREALADDLEQAASQMSPANPDLVQAANDTAESLRNDDGRTGERLNDLADQVDEAGDRVAPNSEIAAGPPDTSSQAPQGNAGSSSSEQQGSSGQQSGAQNQNPGQAGSEAGDPGSGSAAQPGLSNREIDAQNQQSQSGSGSGEQDGSGGGQNASDTPSEAGASGDGQGSSGQSGSEQPSGDSGSSGSAGSSDQEDASQADASQGSGAGGEGDALSTSGQEQQGGASGNENPGERDEADTAQQGEADDAPPPSGGEGADTGTDAAPSGRDSLVLEGTSDENIPSGTNTGTSSLGSGSGASAASGSAAGASVGEAGPDSNRVPAPYRDYVEDYFNRDRP